MVKEESNPVTPFKVSKFHNPMTLQNKQNIMSSIEDKKFFEDLENMHLRHANFRCIVLGTLI